MVPRSVQVIDHVVENSNKSSSNQILIPYKVLIGRGITLNGCDSTVHEDHASKINSHKFNLPATQFLTYQKHKCIKPMYKIEVVWLSSSLRINSFTLCDEQTRPMKEGERLRKNIFTQVKHFTMSNGKHGTSFSKTRFIRQRCALRRYAV